MTTNKTEWKIAAALANAEGLDWGRWAKGLTAPIAESPEAYCSTCDGRCDECGGWGGVTDPLSDARYSCTHGCRSPRERSQVPVADPSDVEAYRADCARRNVEPGSLPALHYNDGRVEWSVDRYLSVEVRVAEYVGYRYVHNGIVCLEMHGDGPMTNAAECVRLMQAAEGDGR